jgi:hypothetical protein
MMYLKGNTLVMMEEVERFIEELDTHCILETYRYLKARQEAIDEFAASRYREPFHAGRSYPEDEGELREFLKEIMNSPGENTSREGNDGKIVSLMVPHVDIKVGKRVYAAGYSAISELDFDRVLLLCTGHYLGSHYFSVTEKDFVTPLGTVKTDREAARHLIKGTHRVISPIDFPHKIEHSVEFQLLFLQHLFPSRDFKVLPVLCGSLSRALGVASRATEIPAVRLFVERLRSLLSGSERTWLVVAGVDLSHVGPKFGHSDPAKFIEYQFREHDRILLDRLSAGDTEGFFAESKKVGDRYNVCGLSSLLVLLELFEGKRGEIIDYDVWYDQPTLSAVSFASALIYED